VRRSGPVNSTNSARMFWAGTTRRVHNKEMTTTADPQALLLQLLDPSNRANPYPAYEQIRERGPLQLPDMTLNVFSSYQDCDDVLRHPSSA
jgi:cytochrome P450